MIDESAIFTDNYSMHAINLDFMQVNYKLSDDFFLHAVLASNYY